MRSLVLAALAAGLGHASCRGSEAHQRPPAPPVLPSAPSPKSADAYLSAAAEPGPAESSAASDPSVAAPEPTPPRLMECEAPRVRIADPLAGGTVFNNAMTTAEAGNVDRTRGVLEAIGDAHHPFGCCFEPWLDEGAAAEGKALLRVVLASDGSVVSAEIDGRRSDVENRATIDCLRDVARSLTYPASPASEETIVEYPFRVSAPP